MPVALTGNYGYLLYGLAYGILSMLVVALFVPLPFREYGLYGPLASSLYTIYGPVTDQGVVVKYFYGPSTSAHESPTE